MEFSQLQKVGFTTVPIFQKGSKTQALTWNESLAPCDQTPEPVSGDTVASSCTPASTIGHEYPGNEINQDVENC